jgi:hypothetical protein
MSRFWVLLTLASLSSGTWALAAEGPPAAATARATVQVEWGDSWSPAEVLQVRNDMYLIHYVGWDSSWDEWVYASRILPAGAIPPPPPHRCCRWNP